MSRRLTLLEQAKMFGQVLARRAVIYTRISSAEQDDSGQVLALTDWANARGWDVVATTGDRLTGDPLRRKGDPPGLRQALQLLSDRKADVLVVFAADRLVRSPVHLLQLVGRIQQLGAQVASYQDGSDLDTTTDAGELMLFLRGWWARWELKLIRARTMAGLDRARAQGKQLGRRRVKAGGAILAGRAAGLSWSQLAKESGVSPSTVRRRHAELLDAASKPSSSG